MRVDGWGLGWTIVGALAGIGAFVYGVRSYQRTFPKRRIEYVVEATPLVNTMVPVEVSFKGSPVKHPFLIRLTIASSSRADIPSASFDSDAPITFSVADRVVAVIDQEDEGIEALVDGQLIVIRPQLIRTTAVITFALLTEGRYRDVRISNPLIDIDVRERNSAGASRMGVREIASVVTSIIGMAIVAGILLTSWTTPLLSVVGILINRLASSD